MKLPPFDHSRQEWDHYKRFHVDNGNFVQLDTGELICTIHSPQPRPGVRREYRAYNLEIVGTNDSHLPALKTKGGEIVKRAWLNRGAMQTLLIDRDTKHVVRLDGFFRNKREGDAFCARVPVNLRGRCAVYFAGEGQTPVGSPVKVGKPTEYTKEEIAHAKTLVAACKVWHEMEQPKVWTGKHYNIGEMQKFTFADMTEHQRIGVAHGTVLSYTMVDHDYLLLAE